MAMMLRNENDLATLRCGVRLSGDTPVIVTQAYIGAEVLGPEVLTPLSAMGGSHDLPERIGAQVEALDAEAAPGAPLWLQTDRNALLAALYPWEAVLAARTGRSVLRIPNFLKNPWRPKLRFRLAICATGSPDLHVALSRMLTALATARRDMLPLIEITVFADAGSRASLSGLVDDLVRTMGVAITLPDPDDSSEAAVAHGPLNPWLAWIAAHHAGAGVDAVQFLCPGFSAGGRGALALTQSPKGHGDTEWVDFVEIDELAAFYDRLGCAIMGFTPLGAATRAEGIHRLVHELAWLRPGPILIDDTDRPMDMLAALWRMLLVGEGLDASAPLALPCYLHPALTVASDATEALQAPDVTGDRILSFGAPMTDRALPKGPIKWLFDPPEGGRTTGSARFSDEVRRSPADALKGRILDGQRARLSSATPRSDLDQARDRGAQAALDFLEKVIKP